MKNTLNRFSHASALLIFLFILVLPSCRLSKAEKAMVKNFDLASTELAESGTLELSYLRKEIIRMNTLRVRMNPESFAVYKTTGMDSGFSVKDLVERQNNLLAVASFAQSLDIYISGDVPSPAISGQAENNPTEDTTISGKIFQAAIDRYVDSRKSKNFGIWMTSFTPMLLTAVSAFKADFNKDEHGLVREYNQTIFDLKSVVKLWSTNFSSLKPEEQELVLEAVNVVKTNSEHMDFIIPRYVESFDSLFSILTELQADAKSRAGLLRKALNFYAQVRSIRQTLPFTK